MDIAIETIMLIAAAIIILILLLVNIRIVPQASEFVIERLGKYKHTWGPGIHIKIPFFDRIAKTITLKEHVLDSPPQPVITKDNVTMQIDTVVYYTIFDSKLFTYGAVNPISALENLTATTLRNIVGELELDGTLTSRDIINCKMTSILDEATDKWGIRVNRVELKNIIPPSEIQNAMENADEGGALTNVRPCLSRSTQGGSHHPRRGGQGGNDTGRRGRKRRQNCKGRG